MEHLLRHGAPIFPLVVAMKPLSLFLIALALLCTPPARAQRVVAAHSQNIMSMPPFKECHASTLVELADGKLMAAWFGGTRESNPDVTIWCSTYQNGRWSTPLSLTDGVINNTLRYPCWNPVLFKTQAGKLFLFYKVGKSPRTWWGMMMHSTNDGRTWSKPGKLPEGFLGPIKNKPIQLPDGDLLHPSSTESVDEKTWHIHLEKSNENGQNWRKISIQNGDFGVIQPTILRYSATKLQLLNRSRHNKVVQTWSNDNGQTWSDLTLTNLPNPNSGVDGLTLRNGTQILVYNPSTTGATWSVGRNKLVVAASKDGTNWQDIHVLTNESTGEFSYPAVIQTADGLVHLSYTQDRKNIRHVVLHIE
jgi:alpha-L-fucosidase